MRKRNVQRTRGERGSLYVNFDETKGCYVYIGGRYYESSAQIHLNAVEARFLRDWLNHHVPARKAKRKAT